MVVGLSNRPSLHASAPASTAPPTYLRVVVARACPLKCAYCHAEGDPGEQRGGLTGDERASLVVAGVRAGIRKIKLLGGEPLIDRDLPELVRAVRAEAPDVDLSVITSGVVSPDRLHALYDAGLTRANMSIHGWSEDAFALRKGNARSYAMRRDFLAALLAAGRPVKLNYVYGGPADAADLGELLAWAAGRPVLVNVLDDLGRDLSPDDVVAAVRGLRGPESSLRIEPDPDSLPTWRLRWDDGLEVEVKHSRLGSLSPWSACATCPVRRRCKEGIHAVRLTYDGVLRPCMDRPDLGLPLGPVLRSSGIDGAVAAWTRWVREAL